MEQVNTNEHSESTVEENHEEPKNETINSEVFKKPQLCLVGPRRGKGIQIRPLSKDTLKTKSEESSEVVPSSTNIGDTANHELKEEPKDSLSETSDEVRKCTIEPQIKKKSAPLAPAQKLKEGTVPYLEPKWGGITNEPYSLDVLKSGVALEPINLTTKSYFVFGRQTNCDIQMAHATVSRYHAVLQYCVGSEDKEAGFYIYDLGSTHGTFLNKNRLRPKTYARVQVGHQIRLGGSSRIYLLQGPDDDMEEESQLTVTELKAKRQRQLLERELAEMECQRKEEEERERRENEGIDWGMGDDADEETDLSENPYASTNNEELYVDDPKKTLRGWFEREGHELEYDVEEKGPGQFLCRIEIPIEGSRGGSMVAEALVKGKKKEAVAQCALEACRLLDRCGLLRQATHESRKRKAKNWEEEDFYDSDDDTFLDRTGAVEKKRQQRMQQAGKAEAQIETYETLTKKHHDVLDQIRLVDEQLNEAVENLKLAKASGSAGDTDGDTLDSFMENLSTVGSVDKKIISKLKVDLAALHKEETHLRKLVNIARPASLPKLEPPSDVTTSSSREKEALKNKLMLKARKKTSIKQKVMNEGRKSSQHDQVVQGDEVEVEEEEIEIECKAAGSVAESIQANRREPKGSSEGRKEDIRTTEVNHERKVIGPSMPDFLMNDSSQRTLDSPEPSQGHTEVVTEKLEGSSRTCDEDEKSKKEAERRRKKNRRRLLQRTEKALERSKSSYDSTDPNYSVWVPPEDQSGDGKTSLNEKLGY